MNKSGRTWAFLVYPDSLPSNWIDLLQQTGLPFAISPLHDKDLDPTGDEKKPHYHVLTYYENPTTYNNVKSNVCDIVHGTIPKKIESIRGMWRYHCHKDNPDKYQYSDNDRFYINDFDLSKVKELTQTEILKRLKNLQQFIIDNNIYEYSDLLDILLINHFDDLYEVAYSKTFFLSTYINSRRYKSEQISKQTASLYNSCGILKKSLDF